MTKFKNLAHLVEKNLPICLVLPDKNIRKTQLKNGLKILTLLCALILFYFNSIQTLLNI